MNKKWKLYRRIFSTLFFLLLTFSIVFEIYKGLFIHLISSQLGILILKLTTGTEQVFFAGLILLFLLIIFMGRTYCSLLCPLGYLQDIFIRLGTTLEVKYSWMIHKKWYSKAIRLGLLFLIIIMFISGNSFLVGLVEPFSIYSRIIFLLTRITDFHLLPRMSVFPFVIILLSVILVLLITLKKGRFFCSWVCPVGTTLWGFSFLSIFRLKINKTLCSGCNICVENCKSGAIDARWEKIDTALCVGCFNCLHSCESNAISIVGKSTTIAIKAPETKKNKDFAQENVESRRKFLKQIATGVVVLVVPFSFSELNNEREKNQIKTRSNFIFPPGGLDYYRFIDHCTGCMVCAQKCPSKIIFPRIGTFKSSQVLPILNFQNGYCTENCIECTLVCPTGALRKMSVDEKETTKIANLELNLGSCIIKTDSLECNICAEICPVNAIKMISNPEGSLPLPNIIQKNCNGCGKCLYRCPAKKKETIFVFSLPG